MKTKYVWFYVTLVTLFNLFTTGNILLCVWRYKHAKHVTWHIVQRNSSSRSSSNSEARLQARLHINTVHLYCSRLLFNSMTSCYAATPQLLFTSFWKHSRKMFCKLLWLMSYYITENQQRKLLRNTLKYALKLLSRQNIVIHFHIYYVTLMCFILGARMAWILNSLLKFNGDLKCFNAAT